MALGKPTYFLGIKEAWKLKKCSTLLILTLFYLKGQVKFPDLKLHIQYIKKQTAQHDSTVQ